MMTFTPPIPIRDLTMAMVLLTMIASGNAGAQTRSAAEPQPKPSPLVAQAAEAAELEGLLKILSEETAVATKTRMNGDYVPGIVTVLHGDEMASMGARTVWDALSMVPGIEAVRDPAGVPSLVVRGIQFPFNSGNVKVLIDSMPATRDNAGINSIVLDLPIQLVERIEVIRGPGSVVYGDFAYMGLVHIITRKTGHGFHARLEEAGGLSGGFFGGGRTASGWEYALSAAGSAGGSADVPARREVDDGRGFGFGSLRYRGFSIAASVATREVEDLSPTLPPVDGQQTHTVLDIRYAFDLSRAARAEVRLNDRISRFRSGTSDLDGDVIEGGLGLTWNGAARQSWLLDASFTRSNIDRAVFRTPSPQPMPGAPPPPVGFTVDDEKLAFVSVMAQNTIEASSKVALTVGGRLDRYGDVDTRVTPRASLVYRASDRHIVKFQYAEGFRAPNFFELYSRGFRQTALNFEVNRTIELNYVHRRPETVVRLTAYHSQLADLIFVVGADAQRRSVFENRRKARVAGGEIELERQIGERLKAVVNTSWFDTRDSRNAQNLFVERDTIPSLLGNIALIAAPRPKTRLAARWLYVGDRRAAATPAYSEFSLTATQKSVLARGLDLRAGVRLSRGRGVIFPQVLPTTTVVAPYEFPKAFVELSWSR
jgi:outer membrane receptor for ferrienterochelin and colicins